MDDGDGRGDGVVAIGVARRRLWLLTPLQSSYVAMPARSLPVYEPGRPLRELFWERDDATYWSVQKVLMEMRARIGAAALVPTAVAKEGQRVAQRLRSVGLGALAATFEHAYTFALSYATLPLFDGTTLTLEIDSMLWRHELAVAALTPHLSVVRDCASTRAIAVGAIRRQALFLLADSYAATFHLALRADENADVDDVRRAPHRSLHDWSLGAPASAFRFALAFADASRGVERLVFDDVWLRAVDVALDTIECEQAHGECSRYTHDALDAQRGAPVCDGGGLVWSAFTAVDGAVVGAYVIVDNALLARAVRDLGALFERWLSDEPRRVRCERVARGIESGIALHGVGADGAYLYATDACGAVERYAATTHSDALLARAALEYSTHATAGDTVAQRTYAHLKAQLAAVEAAEQLRAPLALVWRADAAAAATGVAGDELQRRLASVEAAVPVTDDAARRGAFGELLRARAALAEFVVTRIEVITRTAVCRFDAKVAGCGTTPPPPPPPAARVPSTALRLGHSAVILPPPAPPAPTPSPWLPLECPRAYVPWLRRVERIVDELVSSGQLSGAGGSLFLPEDVERVEEHDDAAFQIVRPTHVVIECPFWSGTTLDAKSVRGCELCKSSHGDVKRAAARDNADVLFRYGHSLCARAAWPPKASPMQLFASTLGEARTGSGAAYYEHRRLLPRDADDDVFVSYDRNEDIGWTFSEFTPLPPATTDAPRRIADFAWAWFGAYSPLSERPRTAMFVASNCGAKGRDAFITELRSHGVAIDARGACGAGAPRTPIDVLPGEHMYNAKVRVGRQYKFVFALENTVGRDYVTEKAHHAFLAGAIPVVWSKVVMSDYFPRDSFIARDEFASVKEMAQHMLRVAGDADAFNAYHQWRVNGVHASVVMTWFRSVELIGCQLCEMQNHGYSSKSCVEWLRNLDDACKQAKLTKRPIFLLFQEVPGCATCTGFGSRVLSNDQVVALIHERFVPLCIYNNQGGHDRDVLERFNEPAWNNPVVRIVDAEKRDVAPRFADDYSLKGMMRLLASVN